MKWNADWRSEYRLIDQTVASPLTHMENLMWEARHHQEMKQDLEVEVKKLRRTVEKYKLLFKKKGLEVDA